MVRNVNIAELDSFRKMILDLVPAAEKILKSALSVPRQRKDKDGKPIKIKSIPGKSVDLARYVLDQYAKLVLPHDPDVHQLHIVDHAALAQIKQAQAVIQEINQHNATANKHNRGLGFGLN